MTLGMAWVRSVGDVREFVVAIDSRLTGGQTWDGCPKVLLLPRSDCVLCFAGDTDHAYPLMIQVQNAIAMHARTRDRTLDVVHLKGHIVRLIKHMRTYIHKLPHGQQSSLPPDVTFIFGGYSWRYKDFRFWKIRAGRDFETEPPNNWSEKQNEKRIHFIGDREAVLEAQKRLAALLREKGKIASGDFDMEPFEVLRDIIRGNLFHSVGGPPQLVKVYEHMNTKPFGVFWPNRESGTVSMLGRPLLKYEMSNWPLLDPDNISFVSRSAVEDDLGDDEVL